MAKVGIIMGSDSDMAVMSKAAEVLDEFGIDYECHIISAHREPDVFFEWHQIMTTIKPTQQILEGRIQMRC